MSMILSCSCLHTAQASCCSCRQESRHTTVPACSFPSRALRATSPHSEAPPEQQRHTCACACACACARAYTDHSMRACIFLCRSPSPLRWAASFLSRTHALRFLDAAQPQLRFMSVTRLAPKNHVLRIRTYVRVASIDADASSC
jgi:hypothetical protein